MRILLNYIMFLPILFLFACKQNSKVETKQDAAYYANYKFEQNDSFINIAINPLYLPASLFTELVSRDKTLEYQLDSLGLKISFYDFLNGVDISKFINEKKINIAIGGDMPTLVAIADNDFIVPICIQNGNVSYISSKRIMMQDIIDKKIGVTEGSIVHYGIVQLLNIQNSLNRNELVFGGLDELAEKLKNNEIDIIGAWEPFASDLLKKNKNYYVVSQVGSTGFMYVKNQLKEKHPEAVKHIISSFVRAWTYLKADKKDFLNVCALNLKDLNLLLKDSLLLAPQEIFEIANEDLLQNSKFTNFSKEELRQGKRLNREYIFLKSEKIVQTDKDWEEIVRNFDNYLLQEVLKNTEKYQLNVFDYRF